MCSFATWKICRQRNDWTLYGMHTDQTVWNSQIGENDGKVYAERYLVTTNWHDFLWDTINKQRTVWISFNKDGRDKLSCSSANITAGEDIVCIGTEIQMSSCNNEEADTRIVVHVKHALENGSKTVHVYTVDIDIVVILTDMFQNLSEINSDLNLRVAYGIANNYTHYSEPKSRYLPMC